MSKVAQKEQPVSTKYDDGDDDNLEHYYCSCSRDIALCGRDISDAPDHTMIETPPEDDCVVCFDLIDTPCSRCGEI